MLDEWLASFAFSRSVRHAPRDFSDAVLLAELLAQLLPAGAVGLHNYPSTGRFQQKLINWDILNRKVLAPLHCELSRQQIEDLARAAPGAISVLLVRIKQQTDKSVSSHSLGKPPRSPIKKPSQPVSSNRGTTVPQVQGAARSVPKLRSSPSGFTTRSLATSKAVQKASGSRSASVTSPTSTCAKSVSPARSAPSTPQKKSSSRTTSSTVRSEYSLFDYLPTSNERPTPESLPSTFARVLQMTDSRREAGLNANSSRTTHVRHAPSLSAATIDSSDGLQMSCGPSQTQTRSTSETSLSSTCPERSCLRIELDLSAISSPNNKETGPTEICEGSFVRLDCLDGDEVESKGAPLARVVRSLPSGDCLIQLFKPLASTEAMSHGEEKPRSVSFVSTPHFIDCCSSQLQQVSGIHYNPVTSSWAVGTPRSSGHPWVRSPTYAKPSSPLCQYTTTVLSRHKFTTVGNHTPIELRAIEPGSSTPSIQNPPPVAEMPEAPSVSLRAEELARPTVFPPVPVDLSTVLDSLPHRFLTSPKKRSRTPPTAPTPIHVTASD